MSTLTTGERVISRALALMENSKAHARKISLILYGERHPAAKYSDALVEEARILHDEGIAPKAIAERLGVPRGTIRSFVEYKHRLGPPSEYYFA